MFYFSLRKQTFGHPERRNRAAVECAASATTGRPALLAYMVSTHDRNFPIATKRRFMDARGNGREPLYTASSRTWKGEARHSKPMLNICLYYIAGSCGRKPINCKETEGAFLRTRMLLLLQILASGFKIAEIFDYYNFSFDLIETECRTQRIGKCINHSRFHPQNQYASVRWISLKLPEKTTIENKSYNKMTTRKYDKTYQS